MRKYRKYGRPFFPIRFLNLLPLSHMFGQAMATFVPPMLQGTVVFMRGYNPHEIVRQVKTRRISVLVSVPKILDVLADHVARLYPDVRQRAGRERGRREALVALPRRASSVRSEILVVRRRRRAARIVARVVLGPARISSSFRATASPRPRPSSR